MSLIELITRCDKKNCTKEGEKGVPEGNRRGSLHTMEKGGVQSVRVGKPQERETKQTEKDEKE